MEKNILPYIFRYLAITKIKKLSYIFLIICFIPSMFWQANAQTFNANTCGTEKQMEIMYKHNADALLESNILRKKISTLKKSKAEPYVIPVVFHVFGTEFNGDTTVTIDIVKDALRRTNEDFQGLNDDYTTIDAPFDAIKQPLDITFKLAQLDPNGNPTTGVLFYNEASGMGHYSSPMVPRVAWDNLKYCNIYITRDLYDDGTHNNSGVAWYPNTGMTNENIARIVYNGSYLASNTDENFRSVLTHEFGHYLDLPHTFDKSVCSDDPEEGDGVADTPSHKKNSSQTACAVIHNCLQQEINNENFMDYTDCYKMFTQGQVERMNNALQNSPARNTLWTNANIQATGLSSDLGPRVVLSSSLSFEERHLNDGVIEGSIDLTCIECTFQNSSGDFILNTDYTVTNLPEGVTPRIQITSNTTATIHLENTASNHNLENSISNLTFTFLDPMIAGGVSQLYKSRLDNLKINFIDEYTEFCNLSVGFTAYAYITNVEFDGKTNPSFGYENEKQWVSDYTKKAIYPVKKGKSYPISITTNKGTRGVSKDNLIIEGWFDWNRNFILENNELMISHSYSNRSTDEQGNYTYTTNIEVPTSIDLGDMAFRIFVSEKGHKGNRSCSALDIGEFEDYGLKVIDENAPFNMDLYANSTTVNFSQKVSFSNLIITEPNDYITSWQWTFEGGEPASSTEKNPANITFPKEGSYDVTLQVVTANGTNQTITKKDYITSRLKYCPSYPYFGQEFRVNRVTLGTIDHAPFHSQSKSYYNKVSTTLIAGNTYPITIKTQKGLGKVNDVNRVRVWADWNFDGVWSQDEMIVSQKVNYADYDDNGEYEFTTNISVPSTAAVGKKIGLRVIGHSISRVGRKEGETSCGTYNSGNTADYGILVSNPTYCTASSQNDSAHITRVSFGNVDNSSVHNSYSDYTIMSDSISVGDQFTLRVETNNDHSALNTLESWIDWNNDGVFDNDKEKVLHTFGAGPYSSNITAPVSAVSNVALRLRVRLGQSSNSISSCGENTYSGEVEDYSIFAYIDVDEDSVLDHIDKCFNTPSGESVDEKGCSQSQIDTDRDGVSDFDNVDKCSNTPSGESVNIAGCSQSQITNIPDNNFERALIDLGYDYDTYGSDGYVISKDIESILRLSVSEYEITDLTGIENFTALEKFSCNLNQLTSLDISKNTALTSLSCFENRLTSLDVSKNTALTNLACLYNQLTGLDVSKNTALTNLECFRNQLTSLDVSQNTNLTYLKCDENLLTSLDVSKNTALTNLTLPFNQLTSLNVSQNTNLTFLRCDSNQLTSLDVSENTALTNLLCSNNQLTSLNLKNGNNSSITRFLAYSNNLKCIQVDNAEWSTANWTLIDRTTIFNEDCSNVDSDNDNDGVADNIDTCPNTPTGEDANESGCSESQIDTDNDGIFNNIDTCPKTPTGEDVNGNGCSESQVDTDNDGVFNNIDQCNNTPSGGDVNAIGCTQVSSNNFEISSTTPSCTNINNGKISIKNISSHMFNFVVTGPNSYNKTFENKLANQPFVIENLAVGMYNITAKFSTDGIGNDIPGFQVAVNGATPVSGTNKSVNRLGKSSVFTVSGDKKYSIFVNDVFQRDETFSDESEYDIVVENLSTGKNHIKIIPENICRGLIENWIIIPNGDIKFYPNPAGDLFHIAGLESSDINVQVFAPDGQQVYNKNHKPVNGVVYFSTRDLSAGFYIVRVSGDKSGDIINFKMTKK